ncbi:putative phosphotransferase with paired acceptor [Rosa chinensis]|uniref:Putative phosphotransferase with paired acceptor n=1 Tax=Rosa chinensis TaxID=74649 RepID=A0A2P6PGB4_ROSCH|nr:putative phosphotransferase with paired acceptor [Rosa chinensis]
MFFISLVLENLCLSTVNNEDLIYCTKVDLSVRMNAIMLTSSRVSFGELPVYGFGLVPY